MKIQKEILVIILVFCLLLTPALACNGPDEEETPTPEAPADAGGGVPDTGPEVVEEPDTGEASGDSAFPDNLKTESFHFTGGGQMNTCVLRGVPPADDLPVIVPLDEYPDYRYELGVMGTRSLCLYGFPAGEEIQVDLYSPSGEHFATGAYYVEPGGVVDILEPEVIEVDPADFSIIPDVIELDPDEIRIIPLDEEGEHDVHVLEITQVYPESLLPNLHAYLVDGVTTFSIPLWWRYGLDAGDWIVTASTSDLYAETGLHFEPPGGFQVLSYNLPDPFTSYNPYCVQILLGEQVPFKGIGLEPNTEISLGIYLTGADSGVLYDSVQVATGEDGYFEYWIATDEGYEAGLFYMVPAPLNEDGLLYLDFYPCFEVVSP